MSADNFAKMMLGTVASNNTSASAASAFEQKMRDAAASYNAMRQVEAELKKDDEKFQVALSGLRRELDTTSRALSSAQSRRVKLQRELEACMHECKELEAKKLATTESILAAQAAAAKQREAKLREFGGGSADLLSDGAVPGSADLLSDDAAPGAPAPASADAIADLLGGDLLDGGASASRDLLGGTMAFGPAAERAAAAPPPAAADEFLGFDTPAPACCSAFNGAANPFSAASAYQHAVNASPAGGAVHWGAPPGGMGGSTNPFGAAPPGPTSGGARGTGGCFAAAVGTPAAPASAAPAPSDPFASLMGGMPTKHK